jgi:hypothetical protein
MNQNAKPKRTYRIESDFELESAWMPQSAFTTHYDSTSSAICVAIEGVDDPAEQEVRVVCVETNEVVWRSTDEEYEGDE